MDERIDKKMPKQSWLQIKIAIYLSLKWSRISVSISYRCGKLQPKYKIHGVVETMPKVLQSKEHYTANCDCHIYHPNTGWLIDDQMISCESFQSNLGSMNPNLQSQHLNIDSMKSSYVFPVQLERSDKSLVMDH